jgi:hypothetical protein
MRRIRAYRPSPAMAVALVALFVSLGGVSYGVATGSIDSREIKNNTVRTKDIRNNDVRGKDIRNSTITGADIKTGTIKGSDIGSNSVTGTDILESSLGIVPAANVANSAGTAAAYGGFKSVHIGASPLVLTNGQTQDVLKAGALTFTAACTINGDPDGGGPDPVGDYARINVVTTQDHAALDGDDTTSDLLIATPIQNRQFVDASSTTTGTPVLDQETDGTALAPDGTEVYTQGIYGAVNILNDPGKCRFGGFFGVG